MFEHSPPRFDERVGERDFGHGEQSFEKPGIDQLVDGTVEVFDAASGLVDEQPTLLV